MARITPTVGRTTRNVAPYPQHDSKDYTTRSSEVRRTVIVYPPPAPHYMSGLIRGRKPPPQAPPPSRRTCTPTADPLANVLDTQAAATLLLFRRPDSDRITPFEFLASVDRHLLSRDIHLKATEFGKMIPLEDLGRTTARFVLRAVHDSWVAANPTPDACKPRCGCVREIMATAPFSRDG
ncbi:hypothetical protein CspHIS471_0303390 [Cutaneotrichosporon sp. HIS471]|nr:hypothetical protein CspHIS471_0303390 [Cutaneotrichosporon sp. HIS471]